VQAAALRPRRRNLTRQEWRNYLSSSGSGAPCARNTHRLECRWYLHGSARKYLSRKGVPPNPGSLSSWGVSLITPARGSIFGTTLGHLRTPASGSNRSQCRHAGRIPSKMQVRHRDGIVHQTQPVKNPHVGVHANTPPQRLCVPEPIQLATRARDVTSTRRSTLRRVHRQYPCHRERSHASSAEASSTDRCVRAGPAP
jgi:hypothetical protein